MLPTMYQYGILVATLFVLALAKEPEPLPQDHLETAPPSTAVAPIPNGGALQEDKENKHHVVFYIFDLDKMAEENRTELLSEENEVPESVFEKETSRLKENHTPAVDWCSQELTALLIFVLLFVLIGMELCACFRNRKNKKYLETLPYLIEDKQYVKLVLQ